MGCYFWYSELVCAHCSYLFTYLLTYCLSSHSANYTLTVAASGAAAVDLLPHQTINYASVCSSCGASFLVIQSSLTSEAPLQALTVKNEADDCSRCAE